MANIIQAAKWMRQGHEVGRISDQSYRYRDSGDGFVEMWNGIEWSATWIFSLGDLGAEDYEIWKE